MAGHYLFANNATSRLRVATPAGSGTITVESGHGDRFPLPTGEDFFMVTLDDRRTGQIEIMQCTARSGDVLTVLRAQEGTTAQDFAPGTLLSNRPTAGTFTHFMETASGLAGWTKEEADERFVNIDGDTMQGYLALVMADPIYPNDAAHKKYVDTQIATRAPAVHNHPISQVINLQTELNARPLEAPTDNRPYGRRNQSWVDISALAFPDWSNIQNKPTTYPPTAHSHPISQVTNLQTELDLRLTDAPTDGKTYGRKSGQWAAAAGAAQISDTAPPTADDATFWWESDRGGLYIRYNDGNSSQWVQVSGTQGETGPEGPPGADSTVPGPPGEPVPPSFPDAPVDGQQYVRQDAAWEPVDIPEGGSSITVGDTPPASPVANSLWWEADTGLLFLYYNDGDSSQWVEVGGGGGAGAYLPLAGGTLSGNLTVNAGAQTDLNVTGQYQTYAHITSTDADAGLNIISEYDGYLTFDHAQSFATATIRSRFAGKMRWEMQLGDGNYEGGANAGSEFALRSFKDDGTFLETPLRTFRNTGYTYLKGLASSTGTSLISTTSLIKGAAKGYFRVNQTGTQALLPGSFNVSSITDGGVGITGGNMTAAMASVNYNTVTACDNSMPSNYNRSLPNGQNTTQFGVVSITGVSAVADLTMAAAVCFGDLA